MSDSPSQSEDPFTSSPENASPRYLWTSRPCRRGRLCRPRFTPVRIVLLCFLAVFLGLVIKYNNPHVANIAHPKDKPEIAIPTLHFQAPEFDRDMADTFAKYKYRESCNISSLDLHAPSSPLCSDRSSLLTAMSSGGRIGRDAPYMPRSCDMRWFSTPEICEILGRFDKVVVIGDSMMRHVVGSINVLVREDIGYGAVTDWNFSEVERQECFCNEQFDVKACSVQGIYNTADVRRNDPGSLKCKEDVDVINDESGTHSPPPIPSSELVSLKTSIGPSNPSPTKKPKAFILGHGLWSNLDHKQSLLWLDTVLEVIRGTMSSDAKDLKRDNEMGNVLFVTPNAAGKEKPDAFIVDQGNKKLVLFEEMMMAEGKRRGIEVLGTWNMSVQANLYDGVHMDMRGNLAKAMMVMNWLNLLG